MIHVISNPPYNIRWEAEENLRGNWPYCECGLPPKQNANFAFVLAGIAKSEGKSAFILPCGVLSTGETKEKAIRKWLIDSGLLCAVLLLPEKMFASTSIPVCVLLFDKTVSKETVLFVDLRKQCTKEERKQKGQCGGACHMNRIYTRFFPAIPDEIITQVANAINMRSNLPEWVVSVPRSEIASKDYYLMPSLYLSGGAEENHARPFADIVDDLNHIVENKNMLRLVVNQNLAQALGFEEINNLQEESNCQSKELSPLLEKLTGKTLLLNDYILLTKKKNELTFQNNHPTRMSEILLSILQMYKVHLMFLNNEENRYLAELQDALLPKLMNGEIIVE